MSETLFGTTYPTLYDLAQGLAAAQPPIVAPPRLVPIPGGAYTHEQLNWQADFVLSNTPGLPGAPAHVVPLTLPYADAAKGIMVRPLGGKLAARIEAVPFTGNPTQYAEMLPIVNAAGIVEQRTSEISDQFLVIADYLRTHPFPSGKRGQNVTHSYAVWIPHPTIDPAVNPRATTVWVIFDHAGRVYELDREGTLWDRGVIPGFETSDALVDVAFNPLNRFEMTVIAASGKVLRINRGAGAASASQSETASRYTVSTLDTYAKPRGVMYSPAGKCYVANYDSGNIRCMDDATIFANLPGVWRLRFKSDGTMVAATLTAHVHLIDSLGNVGPNLMPALLNPAPWGTSAVDGSAFVDMDVDTKGTCGPVDRIYVTRSHGQGNNDIWRMDGDGSNAVFGSAVFRVGTTSSSGWSVVGPSSGLHEYVHYGWLVRCHVDQGRMAVAGFGNMHVPEYMFDPPWPAPGPDFDYSIVNRGRQILQMGGMTNTQTLPSLTCATTRSGAGLKWFDEIAALGFDGALAYYRAGGIGSFLRTITGNDAIGLVVCTCLNSQERMKGGAAYDLALIAWMKANGFVGNPTPAFMNMGLWKVVDHAALDREVLSPVYLDVKQAGTGFVVMPADLQGHTVDAVKYPQYAVPAGVQIVVDKGMPFEKRWPQDTISPGQHAFTAEVSGEAPPRSCRAAIFVV